ncbi:MAG: NAD-dependent epimerase/dehydratase family protein [Anaerolineales bacterium]|nr:NAD-dependent epimerase/dehydratase family protein [Anaerolineales bacterium]
MKYFLTGATGFVGGVVARQLREAGHEVRAVVRTPSKAKALADLGVILHKGDVAEKESMRAPMTGVDGVFHIAGWYKVGVRDATPGEQVNVQGTRNVLELMKALGIPKGVYTSTLAVNSDTHGKMVDENYRFTGQHLSAYDRTKAEAHHIADKFVAEGLPLVILQPGLIYGPEDTSQMGEFLRGFLHGKTQPIPQQTAYCWAHVDDIAWAHIAAMEKAAPGSTYIIAGPRHTFVEGCKIASELTGTKMPLTMPPGMLKMMSGIMGVVEKVLPIEGVYSSEGQRILAGVTYIGDNGKAKRDLGYNPRPLREGLAQTFDYERKKKG